MRVTFEAGRLAGLGDVAIGIEPEPFQLRREFGHPFAVQVDAGLPLERRIDLDELVVHRPIIGVELDLDDGEGGFDGLQDSAEALLALTQCRFGGAHAGQVEHRTDHAYGPAVLVTDHMASIENLRIGAIHTAEAIFVVPGSLAAIEYGMNRSVDAAAVVRVDVRQPPVAGALDAGQRMAVGLLQRVVPEHMIAVQVPIPDGIVGCLGRQAIAHLGVADGALLQRCAQAHHLGHELLAGKIFQSCSPSSIALTRGGPLPVM